MKRLTFFQSTPSAQEFQLQENDVTSMVMKFHPAQQTVRIIYGGTKRLYFLEKSGNKLLIKSEYGVEVGKIRYDRWFHTNGSIELDGKKFQHEVVRGEEDSLILFDKKNHNPLVKCTMLTKTIINQVHAALMLTLCRYLLVPDMEEAMGI